MDTWCELGMLTLSLLFLFLMLNLTNATQLDINCDSIMYSDNWTLGYLRNVSAYCSNGEQ